MVLLSSTDLVVNNPAVSPPNIAQLPSEDVVPSNKGADANQPKVTSAITTSDPRAARELAQNNGVSVLRESVQADGSSILVLQASPDSNTVKTIQQQPSTKSVGKNHTYRALFTPNDPNYSGQWNLPKISAPAAWDITRGSSSVTIAVIDTGTLFSQQWGSSATFTQPDFPTTKRWENAGEKGLTALEGAAPNCTSRTLPLDKSCNNLDDDGNTYIDDWQGWDFMGGWRGNSGCPNFTDGTTYEGTGGSAGYLLYDNDPQPYSCDNPSNSTLLNKDHYTNDCSYAAGACYIGHGTQVASIAAMAGNNGVLGAGVDHNAKVMNLRALDGYGLTDTSMITSAVRYATAKGANVINMSLAVTSCAPGDTDPTLELAMTEAKTAGVTIVAASGNGGNGVVCYPASSNNAIAVGATNSSDNRASFSSYGAQLDIVAPGVDTPTANAPSAYNNVNYFTTGDGTSFAAPHVAGLVALLKSQVPGATPTQIQQWIEQGSDKVAGMNGQTRTDQYGYGRINALSSLTDYASRYYAQSSYPTILPGNSTTSFISYTNTGTAAWYDDISIGTAPVGTKPIHLATSHPINRVSIFGPSWGGDQNRPGGNFAAVYAADGVTLAVDQHVTQPGQIAKFNIPFTVPVDTPPGSYREYFQPIAEGGTTMNDPGTFLDVTVQTPIFTSAYRAQSPYPTLVADNAPQSVWIEYSNTGNVPWYDDTSVGAAPTGTKPIHLATSNGLNRSSTLGSPWGGDRNRPASTFSKVYNTSGVEYGSNPHVVQPGESARFSFTVTAPFGTAAGTYREYFHPIVEGGSTMNDPGTFLDMTVQAATYQSEYVSQSAYPTLVAGGTSVEVFFKYRNTGNSPWYDDNDLAGAPAGTKPVHLATSREINRASLFGAPWGGDKNRPVGNFYKVYQSNGITEVVGAGKVEPGQVAEVRFLLQAPAGQAAGTYREFFRLLVEGGSTMNDPSTFLDVSVQ